MISIVLRCLPIFALIFFASNISAQNQPQPLRSFNQVLEVAIYISKKNPQFINAYESILTPDDVAMCTALGMKAAAVAAVNPKMFIDNSLVKIHALNTAVSMNAYESISNRGLVSKNQLNNHINRQKPVDLVTLLEQNWKICDSGLSAALKRLPEAQLKAYLVWPYSP